MNDVSTLQSGNISDNGLYSSGEGIEIAPYHYSTDSTVSLETEDSHDVISDSPIAGRNISSNYHMAFSFLDKQEDIEEEAELQERHSSCSGFGELDNVHVPHSPNYIGSNGIDLGGESNGSTAEELDTGPFDSATTDPGNVYEDRNGDEGIVSVLVAPGNRRSYENWPIIEENEELFKKKRGVNRSKLSRVAVRQRAPQPLPRPNHVKQKGPRPPAPVPRKRRVSGRLRPSSRSITSEGDMEQADEMGDECEGDDGFVEGTDATALGKRKNKKKLSILAPSLPVASPPSSPSNTPVSISRRRSASRKNRAKPKLKKNLRPTLASADISTQETTTPGPPTSDSDNKELDSIVTDDTHIEDIVEEDMSIRGAAVTTRRQTTYNSTSNGIGSRKLESSSCTPSVESITKKTKSQNAKTTVNPSKSTVPKGVGSDKGASKGGLRESQDSTITLSSETSDTSDNEKKSKGTPPSGIPMSAKSSPRLSRKVLDQENQSPRASPKGTHQVGKFVSKRLSVAAMISQFDTSDGGKPMSPTAKITSPVSKRLPSISSDPTKSVVKKPPPFNKPTSLSKPDIRPKPTSPIPTPLNSTAVNTSSTVKKPIQKNSSSTKKEETISKPLPVTTSSTKGSPSQVKVNSSIPPKPKSPPIVKSSMAKPPSGNGKSTNVSSPSSSSPSLSSSSSSSITREDSKTTRQPVVRKTSLTRTSSNSSLTGKTNSTSSKAASKSPSINQRKLSPAVSPQSSVVHNRVNPSTNKSLAKPLNKDKVLGGSKSISPPISNGLEQSSATEGDSSPTPPFRNKTKNNSSSSFDKTPALRSVSKAAGEKNTSDNVPGNTSTKPKPSAKDTSLSIPVKGKSNQEPVKETVTYSKPFKITSVLKDKSPVINKGKTKPNEPIDSNKESVPPLVKRPVTTKVTTTTPSKVTTTTPSKVTTTTPSKVTTVLESTRDASNGDESKKPTAELSVVKPPLRLQKSSSRRPPPDPPISPPANGTDGAPKRPPRIRSPPPPPPISPQKNVSSTRDEDCQSPRNYEEFIPSFMRTNSTVSLSMSPPIPHEVKTNGEHSSDSNTSYSTKAYEDIVIPVVDPSSSLPPTILRALSFTSVASVDMRDDCIAPPPLPPRNYSIDDPVISLPTTLEPVDENSSVVSSIKRVLSRKKSKDPTCTSSEDDCVTPPPLPSQPIPKRKGVIGLNTSPLLKRKEIILSNVTHIPSSPSPPMRKRDTENVYEEIPSSIIRSNRYRSPHYETADNFLIKPRLVPSYSRDSSPAGSMDSIDGGNRRFSASVCVSTTSGLSPVTLRRANSDKMKNPRIPIIIIPQDTDLNKKSSLQRTPSMDILDDRMNQSVRNSLQDIDYSSEDETPEGVLSPHQCLPQPPKSNYELIEFKDTPSKPNDINYSEEEQEPLYQHINHLDFTSTPWLKRSKKISKDKGSNQLEIARQLSVCHRKLWCEQPEVVRSGLLGTMSDQDRKLQEAIYEVITSEASYMRSLDVLIEHFMDDPGMNPNLPDGRRVIDKRLYHVVFSNVREIRQVSSNFLHELRERQRQSMVMDNMCDIVKKFAESEFGCYVSYCTNQVYQMREITEMLYSNTMFIDYVKRLESHRKCQSLSITSFLLLPMQRITRLPLLVLAILNRISSDHPSHSEVEETLRAVQKLVTACNDGARQMERTEELHQIHNQLNFGKLKPFPLVSISRRLERKGSLVMLELEQRLFGKPRIRKIPVFVFAFTDYILITKRKKGPKGEISFKVVDYSSKAVVEVEKLKTDKKITYPKHSFGEQETIAKATWIVSSANEPHSFLLILLDNSSQKVEKYVLVCQNDTECTRWMESISHPAKEKQKDDEKIYESWDCPQVQAVYDYTAQQHDEISLVRGDIVKVLRKMGDGWYEGEKLRDLQWGWFPSNFTTEIENSHTRARNLKERHRLLSTHLNTQQFSQHFSEAVQ